LEPFAIPKGRKRVELLEIVGRENTMLGRLRKTAVVAAIALGLGSAATWAADKTVTIGHFGNATPMQLVAASDALSKETGWTIEWRKFQAGTDVIAAMASGDIKLSELGSSPLAIAATSGVDLQLFMISDGIGSAEALIARDGAGIKTLEDLKGKKVGVPLGSTAHFSLMGALENAKIPASEVTILGMSPDQIAAAWSQNQIDATFVWDPVQTKVKANGKMIINAGEVKGKPTFDGWVVNREFGEKNKDFVVAFVKAIAKADESYTSNPDAWTADAEPVKTIAKRTGASPADIPTILKGYALPSIKEQLSADWLGGAMAGTIKETAKFLKEQKKIPTVLDDYSKFVNPSFLEAAAK
jgi:taurine transport system substrate-binding protein